MSSDQRSMTIEVSDFNVRAGFIDPRPEVASPSEAPAIAAAMAAPLKQFGVHFSDMRLIHGSQLGERGIETFVGTEMKVRLTAELLDVAVFPNVRKGWAHGLPIFESLVIALAGQVKGLKLGAVLTNWSLHVRPKEATPLTPLPPIRVEGAPMIGALSSVGYALNFGVPPWDDGINGTTVLAEPSAQIANGTFVSLKSSWKLRPENALSPRFQKHLQECENALGIHFTESVNE